MIIGWVKPWLYFPLRRLSQNRPMQVLIGTYLCSWSRRIIPQHSLFLLKSLKCLSKMNVDRVLIDNNI